YGVRPDLTCLGKIIGGGLPVGAYGGRADIMARLAPEGPVYQAGTLSGNPLAMTAGIETLKTLQGAGVYDSLERRSAKLVAGIAHTARESGVQTYATRVGSMFTTFFTDGAAVRDYATAKRADPRKYAIFFQSMLDQGIYFAPSQFEAGFMSIAHTDEDVARTIEAAMNAFKAVRDTR
ncbi:MAG TPA: aminotransferase class III-fold pyridoxal phosphate-dependent enzyme, partial [Chloroflexota bacterium]|nr:aminotransferase class III-fold pyridoxal phosphate-dependent enzyme [Chloroflexota bacterium]